MPLGYGPTVVFTSSAGGDIGGGRQYTRLRGPVFVGTPRAGDSPGSGGLASVSPPHILSMSTVLSDVCLVPTTFASTAGAYVSTGGSTSLGVYMCMTSSGSMITAGSTSLAPTQLTGGQHAAGVILDTKSHALAVYDPLSSSFLLPNAGSGATQSTSAPTFVTYIPLTSGAGNMVAAGSTANAPAVITTGFAALMYDAAKATLAIYDPFSSAWTWPHIPTAAAGSAVTWSASSS